MVYENYGNSLFKNKKNEQESSENNGIEIPSKSEEIKELRKKGLKWAIVLILWIIISIPVTIISLVFFPNLSKLIIYFSVFIPIFIIVSMFLFHISKEQALKSLTSSQLWRIILFILLLLLFLFITLDFFEIIIIF